MYESHSLFQNYPTHLLYYFFLAAFRKSVVTSFGLPSFDRRPNRIIPAMTRTIPPNTVLYALFSALAQTATAYILDIILARDELAFGNKNGFHLFIRQVQFNHDQQCFHDSICIKFHVLRVLRNYYCLQVVCKINIASFGGEILLPSLHNSNLLMHHTGL